MGKVKTPLLIFFCLTLSLWVLPETLYSDSQGQVRFRSGPFQTQLIELFTSQGCSSCPPADAWVNSLAQSPGLWKDIVPIAFHVSYWDYLGWKDPFASKAHTERQRAYSESGAVSQMYTPGVMLNGREWRDWRLDDIPTAEKNAGTLEALWDGRKLDIAYSKKDVSLKAHAALLGFGLTTKILRGENENKKLIQDFVVLNHQQSIPGNSPWTFEFSPDSLGSIKRYAMAVWITGKDEMTPLQATGGWLPEKWSAENLETEKTPSK